MGARASIKSERGSNAGDTSSLQNPQREKKEKKKKSWYNETSFLHFALEHLIVNHT